MTMKIVIVNRSDSKGGAAVVSRRLMYALREAGADVSMLVADRSVDSPWVVEAGSRVSRAIPFLAERLDIYLHNGMNRGDLFKVDTARFGMPLHRHPLLRDADVVLLNWVNQGMMSLGEVARLCESGKQVIWTMHDMWNMTGVCHHAYDCEGYTQRCGRCPLLGGCGGAEDLSRRTHEEKARLYDTHRLQFVAVSHWLADKARRSSLLRDASLTVIPNAFPVHHGLPDRESLHRQADMRHGRRTVRILFGAARIDDPVKDFQTALGALRLLAAHPEAVDVEFVTYGGIRDASLFDGIPVAHRHVGQVNGEEALRSLYGSCDIVLSTSAFETLPGTLVEGQAYGCVPVAFDSGGQRDIVDHLHTGYLAARSGNAGERAQSIADGLLWASSHGQSPEIREAMRRHVENTFSYKAVARSYLELMQG